jgi:hypothetical protein
LRPTLLMHLAAAAQFLPPVVGALARGLRTPGRRWTVVWCLLLGLQDAISLGLASANVHNLWLGHVGAPLTGAVALWMLSHWHDTGTGRLALRVAIPIFVVVSVALSVLVEDPTTFSLFAAPFHALVLLMAALATFVSRSLQERRRLAASDWFWILGGLMLYAGTNTAIQAVVSYLLTAGRQDLMLAVFDLRAAFMLLAFGAIAGGMLCPLPPTPSGSPSWPPSSASGSSWRGSRSP